MVIGARNSGDVAAEMNSTPLIDVMLVLLVLLIITLPLQTHVIRLNTAGGMPPPQRPVVVNLQIDFDGATFWNGRAVDGGALHALLRSAAQQVPQPEIHVKADRLARYDGVAKILADAQRSGVTQIGFVNTDRY
jgi:biopolymer transport protein ExbD